MRPALRVRDPGLLTTVQDAGRDGWTAAGVSRSGAFDPFALAAANRLVGNPSGGAALEVTFRGPVFEALADLVIAVAGADLGFTIEGRPAPCWRAVPVRRGAVIGFRRRAAGCRASLAVAGGLAVAPVLGSASTDVRCGFGGRRLAAGDELAVAGPAGSPSRDDFAARSMPVYTPPGELRVLPGSDPEWFDGDPLTDLCAASWRADAASDRTGLRLGGAAVARRPGDMTTEPVAPGAVQIPPDGRPIVLGPDCGTLGGYPTAAWVISADLPRLAQIAPGDPVRFAAITMDAARWLLAGQRALLETLAPVL